MKWILLLFILTLILLTWRIWWASDNASSWQVGFNSAFKGLIYYPSFSGRGTWQNHDNPESDRPDLGHELSPENFRAQSRHVKKKKKKMKIEGRKIIQTKNYLVGAVVLIFCYMTWYVYCNQSCCALSTHTHTHTTHTHTTHIHTHTHTTPTHTL